MALCALEMEGYIRACVHGAMSVKVLGVECSVQRPHHPAFLRGLIFVRKIKQMGGPIDSRI